MAINSAYCTEFLKPDSDRVGPSLVLKATACQHFADGVMEADPSVNHDLLSAVDQGGSIAQLLDLTRLTSWKFQQFHHRDHSDFFY